MIKSIIYIVELYIIAKFIYKTARFLTTGKVSRGNKKGKSILGKIALLISNRIHYSLDRMIKKQKVKRPTVAPQQQANDTVEFKVYKFTKAN